MVKIIGLTGGIGSGKTTIAKEFEKLGVPIYITDLEAKKLTDLPETLEKIKAEFGNQIFVEGKLDRAALAKVVFSDHLALQKLNKIIHPLVQEHFTNWLNIHQNFSYIIKESAILFESGGYKQCDAIISVIVPENERITRVMLRDTISEVEVRNRIKNQISDEDRIKKSDYIITNIQLNEAIEKVRDIHQQLTRLKG